MRINSSAALLVMAGMAGIVACDEDPAAVPPGNESAAFAISFEVSKARPVLLEVPHTPEPSLEGCAQVVNNEGMFAGWFYDNLGWAPEYPSIAKWNRSGKYFPWWGSAGTSLTQAGELAPVTWVVDVNDRGSLLTRSTEPLQYNSPRDIFVLGPDGTGMAPLPGGYLVFLTDDPVRMDGHGHVMATYWSHFDEHDVPPVWPPNTYILATHLGALDPPADPTRDRPYAPLADCVGEAIDDDGAVYGRCEVEGKLGHYRWVTAGNPVPFPTGADKLRDVRIHDVNRYGEVVEATPNGAIFWSASTGRIDIPNHTSRPFKPVALNDRGVVLLAEFYSEGESLRSGYIAYWTRASGKVVIPTIWPTAVVHDINNQGVIAGCVGGDGPRRLTPAYWKIY